MTDHNTAHYRKGQLTSVITGSDYKIKITSDDGSTNWMNITSDELIKITEVLTDEDDN